MTARYPSAFLLAGLALVAGCRSAPRPADPGAALPPRPQQRIAASGRLAAEGETYPALQQREIACDEGGCDTAGMRQLADLYASLGEFEAAEEILKAAVGRPDAGPDTRRGLARVRARLGDFAGAADALAPLASSATGEPADRQAVAQALLLAGRPESAAALLPEKTDDSEWLALHGLRALARGRPQEAIAPLDAAVRRRPDDAWNAYLLGFACQRAGQTARAIAAWTRCVALPDPPAEAVVGLAELLARQGKLDRAVPLLQKAAAEAGKRPDYWKAAAAIEQAKGNAVGAELARGYARFYAGDPWQAEALWRSLLPRAAGDDARELYAALHNSAFKRLEPQAALKYIDEAVKRWPRDPYFRQRRAETLLGQNRMKEAQAEAKTLETLTPPGQQAGAMELLCRIALDAGDEALLRKSVERCRSLRPDLPDPLLHLAEWQEQQGRSPENLARTLEIYRQVSGIDPKNADARAHIGGLLSDLKRPQEAIPALLQALTLWPRVLEGTPHAQLAQLYTRQGQAAEARFHAAQYPRLRRDKERWPTLLKALRQDPPLDGWRELGELALRRRENWVALCAFRRLVQRAPEDPAGWRGLAAVCKRQGDFAGAFDAVLQARRRDEGAGKR